MNDPVRKLAEHLNREVAQAAYQFNGRLYWFGADNFEQILREHHEGLAERMCEALFEGPASDNPWVLLQIQRVLGVEQTESPNADSSASRAASPAASDQPQVTNYDAEAEASVRADEVNDGVRTNRSVHSAGDHLPSERREGEVEDLQGMEEGEASRHELVTSDQSQATNYQSEAEAGFRERGADRKDLTEDSPGDKTGDAPGPDRATGSSVRSVGGAALSDFEAQIDRQQARIAELIAQCDALRDELEEVRREFKAFCELQEDEAWVRLDDETIERACVQHGFGERVEQFLRDLRDGKLD